MTFVKKGISLEISPDLETSYIAFNMRDPVLGKNKYLRQALSLSYDSDLFNQIYLNGRAIDAQGLLPPGIFGYDPSLRNPYKTHDLAKARELLAKAGYPGGVDAKTGKQLELTYDIGSDSAQAREEATFDMRCFEQLGIQHEASGEHLLPVSRKEHQGDLPDVLRGWVADYPDPEDFLILLYGPNAPPGPNASAFSNPEYDRLYEEMKAMDDTPEREALIHKMVAIVIEECPWIFNFHAPSYVLRHSWDKNGKSHSISGNYAKYIRIEPAVETGLLEGTRTSPTAGCPSMPWPFSSSFSCPAIVINYHKEEKVVVYYIIRRDSSSPFPPCWASASSRSSCSTSSRRLRLSRESSSARTRRRSR